MKFTLFAIVIAMVIIFAALAMGKQEESDKVKIKEWSSTKKCAIQSIERCYFNPGPFFFTKNCRIYKVPLQDGRTFWFRFSWINPDIEEYNQ